jgi:flagellin
MKSLATQAANGIIKTNSDEMGYIASQLEALGNDVNDIASSTVYNGIALMDSSAALTFQTGEGTSDTFSVTLAELNMGTLFAHTQGVGNGLGATAANGGGVPGAYTHNGTATAGEAHTISILDDDQTDDNDADDADATPTGKEAIYVRTTAVTGGDATPDKLFIDELTVTAADMRAFVGHIDTALGTMNSNLNSVGISQRSLSGKEVNLTEAITANSAAKSRIMDTDFAKEQSNSIRLQILQQTATAALSQANMGPQAVLGFLG